MRGFAITTLATAAAAAPLAARQDTGLGESVAGLELDKGLGGQVATLLGAQDGGGLGTALGPLLIGLLGAGVDTTPGVRRDLGDSVAGLELDKGLGGQVATLLGAQDGGGLGTGLGPLLVGLLGAGVDTTPGVRRRDLGDSVAGLELDKGLGGQVATLLGAQDGGGLGTGLGPLLVGLLGAGVSNPVTRDADEAVTLAARQDDLAGLDESVAGLELDKGLGGQVATLLGAQDGGGLGTALGPLLVGLLGAGVKTNPAA